MQALSRLAVSPSKLVSGASAHRFFRAFARADFASMGINRYAIGCGAIAFVRVDSGDCQFRFGYFRDIRCDYGSHRNRNLHHEICEPCASCRHLSPASTMLFAPLGFSRMQFVQPGKGDYPAKPAAQ